MSNDIRTKAFVLRRTNYGEADRILNLLTPGGKLSAMAKGVRREKSKLAGGIELFCLSDVVIHQGKNEFGIITAAKMLHFYQSITLDLSKLDLGSTILKQVSRAADHADSPEYFTLVEQCFAALDTDLDLRLIESYFYLNLARISGEQLNLHRDSTGAKLQPDQTYVWDTYDKVLVPQLGGNIGATEIKLLRLMLSSPLSLVARVQHLDDKLPSVLHIAKSVV